MTDEWYDHQEERKYLAERLLTSQPANFDQLGKLKEDKLEAYLQEVISMCYIVADAFLEHKETNK